MKFRTRVLLVNQNTIPHFRYSVYQYLSEYLWERGFSLRVLAGSPKARQDRSVGFELLEMPLSALSIARLVRAERIDVLISWVDMKHLFLFPMYLCVKGVLGRKVVYWGQGRDLLDRDAQVKNILYWAEQLLCDGIILYSDHLRKYISGQFQKKVFVANNTIYIDYPGLAPERRTEVLRSHGIETPKNIICVGRIQRRKRLETLLAAHELMGRPDVGVVLVGPDEDGIFSKLRQEHVYRLKPLYGTEKFDLISSCDLYCLPGAVGLSIVDAFYCGLPFLTEEGDESAEIGYLRDGENGFIVPRGDTEALADKLLLLLDNEKLRAKFSAEAKREATENASMEKMCEGFRDALLYVTDQPVPGRERPGGSH